MDNLRTLLFGIQGRINRAKYWLAVLIMFGVLAIGLIGAAVIGIGNGVFIVLNPFLIATFVLLTWISLATGIKRLHDRNRSGWWLLALYVLPGVVNRIGLVYGSAGLFTLVCGLISLAIGVWGFVELGCLKGTTGSNAYGPDPRVPPI